MFGIKNLVWFSLFKPVLEALDMRLDVCAKVLERADLLVRLSEMLAQDSEDLLLRLYSTGISEIEINHIAYLIQAQSQLL